MVDYVKKFFDFIQRQNVYRASKLTFKIFFPETSFVYLSQSLLSLYISIWPAPKDKVIIHISPVVTGEASLIEQPKIDCVP